MTTSSEAASGAEDTLVGRVVEGRFQVLERLASGGMGVVYKAEQQPLGRLVALKILELQRGVADESFTKRFFLEASAAAKLTHPNTIVVHDYGQTSDGLYYIAMEYLPGETLGGRLRDQGPMAPAEALHVAIQVASSLHEAHQQGLVHRDLKPGNVMFAPRGGDPLFVKVLDFGLVKMVGEAETDLNLTQSGVMMGSPRYMAPEQVRAKAIDPRTDIYSFGAVFYHVLTGKPPFPAGSAFEAMNHHVYTAPSPFQQVAPGCAAGPQLEAAILRCLAKDPADRFQTMDEVMGALRACAGEAGASAGVGSYLGAGSGSGSWDKLAAAQVAAPAPVAPPPAAPPVATPATAKGPVSTKTVRWDASTAPPPPEPLASAPFAAAAPAGPKRGGALKLALAGFALVFLAGLAAMAALLIPIGEPTPAAVTTGPGEVTSGEPGSGEVTSGEATPDPGTASPPPDAPVEPPPTELGAGEAPVAPEVEEPAPLVLRTDPVGATIRRDGQDLGDSPIPLVIEAGARWTLEISHEGYVTRTVTVLGGQRELTVHLDPAPTRRQGRRVPVPDPVVRPLAPAADPPRTTGPIRPDPRAPDLDNPWAH